MASSNLIVIQQFKQYRDRRTSRNLVSLLRGVDHPRSNVIRQRLADCCAGARCGLSVCPRCAARIRFAEHVKTAKQIVEYFRREPTEHEVSPVSIDGRHVDLDDLTALKREVKRLRQAVVNFHTRKFPDAAFVLYVDIAMTGKIHFHGFVLHCAGKRDSVRGALRAYFTGHKAVHLGWNRDDAEWWKQFEWFHRYSIKSTPVPDQVEPTRSNAIDLGLMVARQLSALCAVRGKGLRGGRMKVGLPKASGKWTRAVWTTHRGETVSAPFTTRIILDGRRIRRRRRNRFADSKFVQERSAYSDKFGKIIRASNPDCLVTRPGVPSICVERSGEQVNQAIDQGESISVSDVQQPRSWAI